MFKSAGREASCREETGLPARARAVALLGAAVRLRIRAVIGIATVAAIAVAAVFVAASPPGALAATTCFGQPATIVGTSNGDTIAGTAGDDVIAGLGGNDIITGGGGNDLICGGSGNDGINGGDGGDQIAGEDGYDLVVGGPGADFIDGGLGTDALYGSAGDDEIHAGAGSDYVHGGDDGDTLFGDDDGDYLDGNAGANTVDGGNGTDTCQSGTLTGCESAPTPPCAPAFAAEFGVRNPSRMTVLNPCFTASATVTSSPTLQPDGDETFNVSVDGSGEVLHIEFVPRDAGHFVLPSNGSHIRLVGVRATDSHGKLEIHPVYQEDYGGGSYFSGPQYAGNPDNAYSGPCWREDGTECSWGSSGGTDTTPPTAPSDVIANSVASTQVALSWKASSDNVGVTGYDIIRNGVRIGTSATPSFTDSTVQPATSYSYVIDAFDDADNTSAGSAPLAVTTPTAGTRILTVRPSDDAYTESDTVSTNYGSSNQIIADNSPVKHLLVKFGVSGVGSSTVTSAKLRLFCVDPSSFGGDFHAVADTTWRETTVTWNNEPAADPASLGTLGAVASGNWYELAVGSLVRGDGTYSIKATSTSSDGAHYSSKEGTAAPQLVLTVSDVQTPDTTKPSAPTNLAATAVSATQVNLSWTASIDNVGVTGYDVLRDGTVIGTAPSTSYTDSTAQGATTYTYAVRAFDAAGNRSDLSDSASVTTPVPPLTFSPTDDASVRSDATGSNFGAATSLEADGKPRRDFLLTFSVTGVGTRRVVSAKLRLRCVDSSNRGGDFHRVANTSWSEQTVTWANAPAADTTVLASLGSVSSGTWYEVDVTSLVQGDGVVSLRVTSPAANGAAYSSKEGTASLAPQLVVTLAP